VIAITFALPAESSHLIRLLRDRKRGKRNDVFTICGTIEQRSVEILHTGVGEKTCRQRMAGFLQDREFECLISAGFAGALTDELGIGDILHASNFSTLSPREDSDQSIHTGNLYTGQSMIDSREERAELAQRTGAIAIDMETKFIARACAEHALPMLALRVISDSPSQRLPAPPDVLFNLTKQRTELGRLGAYFLGHPGRVVSLLRFSRQIARARKALASAIVNVLPQT
jgi:nucleoside phosphorylase